MLRTGKALLQRTIALALIVGPFACAGFGFVFAQSSDSRYESPMERLVSLDRYGSTDVPMDSWIYPALERLSALGFVPSQSVAIRPWTRLECLRQVREAEELIDPVDSREPTPEAENLLNDLLHELNEPLTKNSATVEAVYGRYGTIAGPALGDGYHFGQTWRNDFGRPLGRGSSAILGYSGRVTLGRFYLHTRQEVQTSPGVPAVTPALSELLIQLDGLSFGSYPANFHLPSPPVHAAASVHALDMYAGLAFNGARLSFGKQEVFWGPGTSGPLSFSSNAEPTYSLRLSASRPHPFPLVPRLGAYRFDFVLGKLSGHKYPARPYFNGQKLDITLGRNFEFSFTRWSVFWGVGHPMTFGNLEKNLFSFSSTGCGFGYGDRCDPGDRKGGFDFRWHVPGVEKYVTLYADSYSDDDPNPLAAPRRNVWAPGVYFARIPYVPHMDLRIEAASSEELARDEGGTRFFINNQYRDSNTNKGFLLGNAVGRDGRSIEGRSTYWVSSKTRIEAGVRQTKVGLGFLPAGGTISDQFAKANYAFSSTWAVEIFMQHERFLIPSFESGAQHNQSAWFEIVYNPDHIISLHR